MALALMRQGIMGVHFGFTSAAPRSSAWCSCTCRTLHQYSGQATLREPAVSQAAASNALGPLELIYRAILSVAVFSSICCSRAVCLPHPCLAHLICPRAPYERKCSTAVSILHRSRSVVHVPVLHVCIELCAAHLRVL